MAKVTISFVFVLINGVMSLTEPSAAAKQTSNHSCSPWSEPTTNGTCDCTTFGKHAYHGNEIVWCLYNNASLPYCYCMSYNKDYNETVVGYCSVRCYVQPLDPGRKVFTGINRYQVIVKSYNLTEFNDETCSSLQMNRTGQMCGRCTKGYAPPVYSYRLSCVNCTDYKYSWVKYVVAAYVPLTVFFVIVILFRISAASGAMNGFIVISQVLVSPAMLTPYISYNEYLSRHTLERVSFQFVTTFFGVWNLDFFRSLYTPFCVHPNMSAIQTRALDYGIAVYPLVLVIVTYIFVSLHYRSSVIVQLWKPFYRCFMFFRKEWDIRNSLIGAFDTFILLSYVKILNISLDLLTPVSLYDKNGNALRQLYVYMDGSVKYFGEEHCPYGVLAIIMVLLFNIFPLVLLCAFPCKWFHRCLNYFEIQRETLREFMVVFHGEFQDQPHDYRYFPAFYLLLRIVNLLMLFSSKGILHYLLSAGLFALSAILIASFKPYRKPFHNYLDIVLMSAIAFTFLGVPAEKLVIMSDDTKDYSAYKVLWYVIALIHPLYGIGMLIYIFAPMQMLKKCISPILALICNYCKKQSQQPQERIPYRLEHMEEYPPLLPHV